ncbi:hypothetical protein ACTI_73370 [Actinoplanes sp. OR16]|nr:hypothetical protein ACTI_73370 [Actinoplanes sp. OR16]
MGHEFRGGEGLGVRSEAEQHRGGVRDVLQRDGGALPAVRVGGSEGAQRQTGRLGTEDVGEGGDAGGRQAYQGGLLDGGPLVSIYVRLPERGQVESVGPGGFLRQRAETHDRGDSVRPRPATSGGDQIPDAGLDDEPERVEPAGDLAGPRRPAAVPDLDHLIAPERFGDREQVRHRVGLPVPAVGVEVEPLPDPHRRLSVRDRQRRHQLEFGGGHLSAQTELGSGLRHAGQEQRLGLIGGHPGQPGPVAVHELVSAGRPRLGVDRHTRRGERLHVAVDGPGGDTELRGQPGGAQPPAALQQQHQGQQPARTHPAHSASHH